MALLTAGALYLTKQFCPGGALPTDAFDGKLCYDGGDIIPLPLDKLDTIITKCPSCDTGQSKSVRSDGKCGCIDVGSTACGNGFVRVSSGCVCNRAAKQCKAGTVARLDKNGKCVCVGCSLKYTPGGINGNECIPIPVRGAPAGTVSGSKPTPTTACSGKSGNCTWDCKNAYCWTGIVGTRTFK